MLIIRNAQLKVLARGSLESFIQRATEHLRRTVPDRCEHLGDAEVRRSIETAVAKSRTYGLRDELEILRYLNLMYVLGFDFDSSEKYPRAREILSDSTMRSKSKAVALGERARQERPPASTPEPVYE